jgi:hypothetical protein
MVKHNIRDITINFGLQHPALWQAPAAGGYPPYRHHRALKRAI